VGSSRKGKRRIVVDDVEYFWTATGSDHGITVAVVTGDAFVHGQRGQWLRFAVGYGSASVPQEGGWRLIAQRSVTPGVVRRAIEVARRRGFTGREGLPDMVLTPEESAAALAETPERRIARMLAAASDALADGRMEVVIGLFGDIGETIAKDPECGHFMVLDAWFKAAADRLRAQVVGIQGYVDATLATLEKDWPNRQFPTERCRERHAALMMFLNHARRAGLADVDDAVDRRGLAARLERA
jgi:hypothetical protein